MDIIFVLLGIGVSVLIGFSVYTILLGRVINNNALHTVALSYGVGVGVLSLQLFFYAWLTIPITLLSVNVPWIPVVLLAAKKLLHIRFPAVRHTSIERIFFVGLVGITSVVFLESILRPVIAWDGFATWFLAAKSFYIQKDIMPDFYRYADFDIPPLSSLYISYLYFWIGAVNDRITLLIFPFFYLSLLILFYFFAKQFMATTMALLFTFFLATMQNVIRHAGRFDVGHVDIVLSYYFFLSFYLLVVFIQKKSFRVLLLLELILAVGALIKNDGVPFFFIVNAAVFIYIVIWCRFYYSVAILFGLVPFLAWNYFKATLGIPESYLQAGIPIFSRIPQIGIQVIQEFLHISRWNVLWIAFVFALFVHKRSVITTLLLAVISMQLGIYLVVFVITPLPVGEHMQGSLDRLLLHLAPLALLFTAITSQQVLTQKDTI